MRVFITVLVLIFSFQSWTKADDISEFEIEGMSIGDSLLDFLNENEINSFEKNYYQGSKKYYRLENNQNFNKKLQEFEQIAFEIKENDTKYKLQAINGTFDYKNNIENCYPKMKEIVNDITSSLKKPMSRSYVFEYPNDGGISEITDFEYSNGVIRVWCTDYSKKREEDNWVDHLSVTASSKKFLNWLKIAR